MECKAEERSFLSKITIKEVVVLGAILLIIPVLKVFYGVLYMYPLLPGIIGILCPVIMNAIGSSLGIGMISRSTSGGSVRSPLLAMRSFLGIVLCEANLIFSIINFFFLKQRFCELATTGEIELLDVMGGWGILASGLTCGFCGMVSSFGSAVVNSASSIAIAGNPKMFSKLISLQLIVGGVGIFGTVVSLFFLKLPIA